MSAIADLARTGAAISAARRAAGLTQAQLAEIAGLTRSSIANTEAGRQRIPSTTLAAIAARLGTTTSQLLGENPVEESRIPTTLAAQLAGHQREITKLLAEMADALLVLAAASQRAEATLDAARLAHTRTDIEETP